MVPELRARGIGEILDSAVALYRECFARLMLLTAAVVVPVQIFTAIVLLSAQPDHFEPSVTGTPTPVYTSGDDAARLGATFFVVIVTVISTIFVVAACTRVVADAYVDHDESVGDALRLAGRRLLPLIGLTIIVTLAQVAGLLACFVGVIVPITFFAVAVPAFILEDVPVFRALGRSIELTKSKFWHVMGLVLAAQALGFVLQTGLTALLGLGLASDSPTLLVVMQAVVNSVSTVITTPFIAAATLVLYFDLRVRVEGFDIQLLMQRVDERHTRAAAPIASAAR